MTSINGASVNSAFLAGQYGLQNASDGITQAASNIAQRTAEGSSSSNNVQENAQVEPSNGNLTSDLIALNINSVNAEASARVLEVANDTLGTIIDTIA
ncbi:hypothetical protein [Alteromonas gracilis]|uniref:hypothetical protein n=1 Tax=Alteromonas gracilis TaxID=1479524 RepID=UPI0030D2941F